MSTDTQFKTYWIVDGVKHTNFRIVIKLVNSGKTAVEISATKQRLESERRKMIARSNAIKDEEIRRAAAEREHATSPEGQQEAARRTALENPGGVVSGGPNPIAELDAYLPHKTSLLR